MNEKILIVDDDELVRSGLAVNLERAGYEVYEACDSVGVKTTIGDYPIELVICDLVLGEEHGMDILRYLQLNNPETSVVIITGHGSVRSALEALKGGASDYIQKPADPEEVIHRVQMVLDSVNLRRSLTEERTRAEERKRVVHDQLNRTERMSSLGTLAEGAAGDLKETLEPAEKLLDQLMRLIENGHDAHPMLKEVDESLRKASSVIRDLEAIGKSTDLNKRSVQINDVIKSFINSAEHQRLMELHPKVKIVPELEGQLPLVAGSKEQLFQMIANLSTNAIESMTSGGVLQVITSVETVESAISRFGSQKPGEFIKIRFEDTAVRMSDEDIERFFEPFYVRTELGRKVLSGLGMTLVYRVVEDHGGLVDIQADNAVGNAIVVYLPVSEEGENAVLELQPDYTGRECILLVDDSAQQRSEAQKMLEDLGYNVETTENGQAAVALVKEKLEKEPAKAPYDLMVIDLILGDEYDGVETFKDVRELSAGQKAILASGFADITRIVEARKLGINRCFQKPYTPENLGKNIRLALDEE